MCGPTRQHHRMRVLLVEDERAIAQPLVDGLEREGLSVIHVVTGSEALRAEGYDMVLLDLGLPDIDGVDVLRELRDRSTVPIIITTARSRETDMIVGLEIGADDYVVKPFGVRHLLARIRAVTRRASFALQDGSEGPIVVGGLSVNPGSRTAELDGMPIEFTPREFDLLARLASEPGTVVSREQLYRDVWGGEWYGSPKTIDVHVAGLRRKLGNPAWIEASRGVGFRVVEQPAALAAAE